MEGKEKRVEEKEVEKGKREKVVLGKVLFVFLFDCVFLHLPFSPLHPPHHHAT